MRNLSEFDIELAQRLNIITPNTLTHASSDFVEYWQRVAQEAQRRKQTHEHSNSNCLLYHQR